MQSNRSALCTLTDMYQGSEGALHNPSEVLTCLVRRLPALAPMSNVERMLRSPTGSCVYMSKPNHHVLIWRRGTTDRQA